MLLHFPVEFLLKLLGNLFTANRQQFNSLY
jgi:hypothetical protein